MKIHKSLANKKNGNTNKNRITTSHTQCAYFSVQYKKRIQFLKAGMSYIWFP